MFFMTTKTKMKRVRWLAGLTLALLFLSLSSPLIYRILPAFMPEFDAVFSNLNPEWEGIIELVFVLAHLLFLCCFVVFFVRLFRGLKHGKIFVPGNARWLYVGAWLPLTGIIFRLVHMCLLSGGYRFALTALVAQTIHNLTLFSGITLMALLYDLATDVSEENRLTV